MNLIANEGVKYSHGRWTAEEDNQLATAVDAQLANASSRKASSKAVRPKQTPCSRRKRIGIRWTVVSKQVRTRSGKQCRERWINHLAPDLCRKTWTNEEDMLLLQLAELHSCRWTDIADYMPGRSQNSVRHRWISLVKSKKKTSTDVLEKKTFPVYTSIVEDQRYPVVKQKQETFEQEDLFPLLPELDYTDVFRETMYNPSVFDGLLGF